MKNSDKKTELQQPEYRLSGAYLANKEVEKAKTKSEKQKAKGKGRKKESLITFMPDPVLSAHTPTSLVAAFNALPLIKKLPPVAIMLQVYNKTLDKLLEGVQIHDFNWRYTYVNNTLAKQSPYTRQQMLGHTIMELYPGIEQTEMFKAMQRCMVQRTSEQVESEFVFPNGTKVYYEMSMQPVAEGILVLTIDRTEQQKAREMKERLQYDRQNFMALINNTTDYMWSVDRGYKLISFNQPLENMLKLQHGNRMLKGANMLNFAPTPGQAARYKDCYQRCFNGNSFTDVEYIERDQTWVEISYYPIRDGLDVIGVACHAHDITESKKAITTIRKLNEHTTVANKQLLAILNALPANIGLLDQAGTIINVNQAWKLFSAHTNLVGENYNTVCGFATGAGAEDAAAMAEGVRMLLYGHLQEFALEYPCHLPHEKRWFRLEVRPLDNGMETGAVVMHINITQRKIAEEEIIEMNNELENRVIHRTRALMDANTSLEAFSYSVSHDLRSPVRSIMGFSKLILKEYGHTMCDDQKSLFNHIENGGRRMNSIIDDLLVLCKSGSSNLNIIPVNLTTLFNNVWENILLSNRHNATLELPQLPDVHADSSMLQQVLVNLLSNAIKYSGKKENPQITVGYSQTVEDIAVWVKDNGAGFDMQFYDRLFGAFQRLHGFSEFEGTGVGLALVKRIIERHGGEVWAEGVENEGATFYFKLPLKPAPPSSGC